ncbi:AAA family ATPase [Aureimonas sp. Leaf324]|uniref:AAA family ATPase n=1 Tax=Aureimonas sp. Leaf324 TaxID=1736336 RepID=UPI0006FD4958|nr:AAA family ATPase [Aureimonas sp. Leaf324]KQQ85693.1 hypothetical protein ASF65_03855 [Aureimonas sp. Leaf324]
MAARRSAPTALTSFDDLRVDFGPEECPLTVEEQREAAIGFLAPSRFAIHREFVRSFSDAQIDRIRQDSPLVIVVTTPIDGGLLEPPLRCSIDWLLAGDEVDRKVVFVHLSGDPLIDGQLNAEALLTHIAKGRVLIVTTTGDAAFSFPPLVDLSITLSLPGSDALRDTFTRRYGSVDIGGDIPSWPPTLTHATFDVACAKGVSASEAWALAMDLMCIEKPGPEEPGAKAAATALPPRPLEELRGYGSAMSWATDLVRDVADFRAGRIAWTDVSPGALMVGPPGTGKSTFAGSVAASASLHLVSTSFSAWQSSGSGHLGDVTKSIQSAFAEARRSAPSLVFIDELGSLPARGTEGRYDAYWSTVVDCLLAELDGGDARAGFTVLAACNDATRLDPALLRSGRLEQRLVIGLPDASDLAAILAQHLGGALSSAELTPIAQILAGSASGADAAAVAREARRSARRQGRAVTLADVELAALPVDDLSDEVRRRIAVHESGHLVVALACGSVPSSMSAGVAGTGPKVLLGRPGGPIPLASDLDAHIVVLLAGRAAEMLVLGCSSTGSGGGDDSDLAAATDVAGRMIGRLGFCGTLAYEPSVERARIEPILQAAAGRAHALLIRHRDALDAFVTALLARRHLDRAAILEIASGFGLPASSAQEAGR